MAKNPFLMPPDVDFFVLRDHEREKRQADLEVQKALKIHEKMTKCQIKAKLDGIRKEVRKEIQKGDNESQREEETSRDMESPDSAAWKLAVTKDHPAAETLLEYTKKKREMFYLQYALFVKRNEIQKMETIAVREETKLEKAEQFLEEDAAMFDEFLKENDRCSVEAIKIADKETKRKMDKMAEIKKLSAQVMNIKSDIAKHEEILNEYMMLQEFLFKLSPPEWQEKHRKKPKEAKSSQSSGKEKNNLEAKLTKSSSVTGRSDSRSSSQHLHRWDSASSSTKRSTSKIAPGKKMSEASQHLVPVQSVQQVLQEEDEDSALYFTDPKQLLKIFTELEEQNLSLIQNSQDIEESLEEIKHNFVFTKEKMEKEIKQLRELTSCMKACIATEEEKSAELQLKSQVFSFEQKSEEDQDSMLKALHRKVKDVYQSCLGDDQAKLTTLQMLMYIETQMEDLLDKIETIPSKKLEVAEKLKDKERRVRLREEKMRQQKIHQEERLRRAMERAQADAKKTTGRRLVFRSDPPATKPRIEKDEDTIEKEKEEAAYFFSQ
ncbi:cilia- and flagella-associated protein 100 isoform X2 [Microcaecilia unicolor]|nr:cilia- and flagella-associated protein 100 isoform X2 [Microcaecilia unicolor]XP_030063548.1 cilia- and flagella-associated protein 100 isoform X2 [Microcaecilia unicolor]